jgi:hypothetical protein
MTGWQIGDRAVCAALMALGGALLLVRPRRHVARIAWLALVVAGLVHALALETRETNLVQTNLVHYYLGAKYPFRYADLYLLVQAALDRPPVAIRDLDHPPAMLRPGLADQRAYYLDLLRAARVPFDSLAPLEDLARRARASGALATESERRQRPGGAGAAPARAGAEVRGARLAAARPRAGAGRARDRRAAGTGGLPSVTDPGARGT